MPTLSDLCDNIRDQCEPGADTTGVYVGLEHIPSGAWRLMQHGRPGEVRSSKFAFRRGDVLYGKLRPYLDKAIVAGSDGICSTDILVLRAKPDVVPEYVLSVVHSQAFRTHADATTHGVNHPRTSWAGIAEFQCNKPAHQLQAKVAAALATIHRLVEARSGVIESTLELKRSAVEKLFTLGLRGGRPRNTEIGLVPAAWKIQRLDDCCRVVTSSLSYTDLAALPRSEEASAVPVMGIKVSDMNAPGNELAMASAKLLKHMPLAAARRYAVPQAAIAFPKRGAAIATNKKRILTTWTVLDPNLIAVEAGDEIDPRFLFHWFQRFDLRTITEPGPTPQLNKKNLVPLQIAHPMTKEEQAEIAALLDAFDRTVLTQQKAQAAAEELIQSTLASAMANEVLLGDLDVDTSLLIGSTP